MDTLYTVLVCRSYGKRAVWRYPNLDPWELHRRIGRSGKHKLGQGCTVRRRCTAMSKFRGAIAIIADWLTENTQIQHFDCQSDCRTCLNPYLLVDIQKYGLSQVIPVMGFQKLIKKKTKLQISPSISKKAFYNLLVFNLIVLLLLVIVLSQFIFQI